MAVANNGWASVVEAALYFTDERHITTLWDALADDDAKNKILNMAYNRIYYCPDFSTPAAGAETAAELVYLIKAQSEMAYYLLMHIEDEDRRKGIQAQGVTTAGIVKEVYDKDRLNEVPIPAFVADILEDAGFVTPSGFGIIDIARDEDESVSTKIDEF